MSRSRNWCFTLNNYSELQLQNLLKENSQIRYMLVGKEIGDEKQTPHLQGFVIFHNPKTFDQVKNFLGSDFHIEQCKGTVSQNIAYCKKSNDFLEYGDPPHQGSRSDISQVKDMVKQGKSMSEIYESATSYQSIRMAEIGKKYQPLKPREAPEVRWYYGATGTGKTRSAYEELGYDDTWVNSNTLQWFDGYDGHKNVIIDDFRANQCTFAFLLRLLDRYPMRVPVKGGFVNWLPERIFITSQNHPDSTYTDDKISENIEQLIRRINIIQEFK